MASPTPPKLKDVHGSAAQWARARKRGNNSLDQLTCNDELCWTAESAGMLRHGPGSSPSPPHPEFRERPWHRR